MRTMDLREMRHRRANLVEQARTLLDRSDSEKRDLSQEEQNQYDRLFAEIKAMRDREGRQEALDAEERDLGQSAGTVAARRDQPMDAASSTESGQPVLQPTAYRNGLPVGLTESRDRLQFRGIEIKRDPQARRAMNAWAAFGMGALNADERRALQSDVDNVGGYLRPDQEFVARLIQAVDDAVYLRQAATVMTVMSADSLGMPSLTADPADADWTTELATGNADSTMALGKRELRPHPLAKRILVSNKLLRQTGQAGAVDAEALVRERLAYKFAITEEKAYLTGSGNLQPLGVFTASVDGISTGRDVSTGNTSTSITTDGLQEAFWALKPQYRARSQWLFHTDALKQIAKLKDGDGQYIWQQGVTTGAPPSLLTRPYMESRYAPNTFTTTLYVGIIGDFSYYWIADALTMQMQRLVELYAATNQTGFIARLETDGAPVLEEAFARVKLA